MRNVVRFMIVAVATLLLPITVLAQAPQDEVVYYHVDAVGSVRATTDSNGQTLTRFDYLPFGEPWPAPGSERLQFTGAERDSSTGLTYLIARYVFVNAGRFTSPDTAAYSDADNPQTWNLYVYVTNRPLNFIDPSGHECINTSTNTSATVTCTTTWEQVMQNLIDVSQRTPPLIANQLPSGYLWALNKIPFLNSTTSNFSAGLGDALLMGTGPFLRRQLGIDVVDECSGAYSAGGWASFAFGAARVGYAGAAKGVSILASSGAQASALRQSLKTIARLGIASSWRQPTLAKYATDEALREAAGRTNIYVNLWGAGTAAAGAVEGVGCGQ